MDFRSKRILHKPTGRGAEQIAIVWGTQRGLDPRATGGNTAQGQTTGLIFPALQGGQDSAFTHTELGGKTE